MSFMLRDSNPSAGRIADEAMQVRKMEEVKKLCELMRLKEALAAKEEEMSAKQHALEEELRGGQLGLIELLRLGAAVLQPVVELSMYRVEAGQEERHVLD